MVDIFPSEVLKGDGRLNFFAAQLYFSKGFQLTGTMHSTSLPTSCKIAPNHANVSPQFEERRNVLLRHAKRKDLAWEYQSAQNTYSFNKWDKK